MPHLYILAGIWEFPSYENKYKEFFVFQFDAVENGIQVSKLMQIFSKQAAMIDALISHFTDQIRNKKQEGNTQEPFHDGKAFDINVKLSSLN